MKLWLVMNAGYDFENDVHAVCTSKESAIELWKKLEKKQGKSLPWNQCGYLEIDSDKLYTKNFTKEI